MLKGCFLGLLIGIEFSLVLTLVFDQCRMVFTIARILFFVDGMAPAAVLFVTVRMVNLNFAVF